MVYTDIKGFHTLNFIGSAISGTISGVAGIIGQASTNKSNERIARENREQEKALFYEQMAYNEREAQANRDFQQSTLDQQQAFAREQTEYQSAENQRQRWEDAGFSPWALASQGNAGQAVSSGSPASGSQATAPSAPNLSMAQYQSPLLAGLSSYFGMVNSINQTRDSVQGAKESDSRIDLNYALAGKERSSADLNKQMFDYLTKANPLRLELEGANAGIALLQQKYDAQTLVHRINQQAQQSAQADLMTSMMKLDLEKQEIAMKYFEVDQLLNINMKSQELSNLIATGELTRAQAATELAKQMDYYASANLKGKQAGLVEQQTKTEQANTRIANANADIAENNAWDSNVEHEVKEAQKWEIKALASKMIDNAYIDSLNKGIELSIDNVYLSRNQRDLVTKREIIDKQDEILPFASTVIDAVNAANGYAPTEVREFYDEYKDKRTGRTTSSRIRRTSRK